ncbi:LytR C-terminal domain-containing protein [Conexibacter sp. SYSU D00693]|uniref:LytR C-terminal domain-containing protein n=1 Tax=Conexibacter sp. SYSU D00693 TaxID=2812560 RepID=UPI00196A63B0|nr:LytR C-terminal domain-containing protein [Conexibacter sp. SYSU D00693]
MNDFLDDLERELRDAHPRRRAARRRAAVGAAVRRAPAVVGVLAAVALGVALTGVLGGDGEDEGAGVPAATSTTPALTVPGGAVDVEDRTLLAGVRVAVLNETTTTGLARAVGERLEHHGADLRTVTSGPNQTRQRTAVVFREGHREAAARVARVLGVDRVSPLRTTTAAIAGRDADVVVLAGADRTTGLVSNSTRTASCDPRFAEETARTIDPARGDVAGGPLAVLGARGTIATSRDAFDGLGYKLPITVADGEEAEVTVPRQLRGKVGLVYDLGVQRRVLRDGIRAASSVMRFVACPRGGESPRTGFGGGIVTDRPRCATLLVRTQGERLALRLPVPLGRSCG